VGGPERGEQASGAPTGEIAGRAWRLLRELLEAHQVRWRRALAERGLTMVQAHALMRMSEMPPGPMSRLAERLGVDPSWVTGLVDRLQARGEVVRRPSPEDRRVKIVELTGAGRETCQALLRLSGEPPPALAGSHAERTLNAQHQVGRREAAPPGRTHTGTRRHAPVRRQRQSGPARRRPERRRQLVRQPHRQPSRRRIAHVPRHLAVAVEGKNAGQLAFDGDATGRGCKGGIDGSRGHKREFDDRHRPRRLHRYEQDDDGGEGGDDGEAAGRKGH